VSAPGLFRALAAGSLLALLALRADAGAMSPCNNPTIFDAKVQIHIFPYQADGILSSKGRALATLLQRHVLFAALKYPSIGVQELIDYGGLCSYGKTTGQIRSRLKPGQTAIFLSGRMFEQDGRIYLKNVVSVTTPDATLNWQLATQANVTTHTPLDISGFAPRTIPVSFLDQLESSQAQSRRVHTEPNEQSPSKPMPSGSAAQYTFSVLEVRDEWMRVQVMPYDIRGWLPAHALANGDELKGEFPELYFVDGLVGYFSMPTHPAQDRGLLDKTLASFDRYLQVTADRAEADPRALAMVLEGNAKLRAAGAQWPTATLQAARDDYQRAAAESPSWSPATSHLLACTALICARGACAERAKTLERDYLEAINRDPLSPDLIAGLRGYYDAAALERLDSDLSVEVLKARSEKVQGVQARMLQPH
jgi:hypothetical protein